MLWNAAFGVLLVIGGYFLPKIIYRTLLIAHFVVLWTIPLLTGEGYNDVVLLFAYTAGVIGTTEVIGAIAQRQKELLAQFAAAEERAKTSESLLRNILDTSPNQIVLKDTELRYLFVNPAYGEVTGWTEEDVLGKRDSELFSAERAEEYERLDRSVILRGEAQPEMIDWMYRQDGQKRWYKLVKRPIFDEQGNVELVLSISSDITELKQAQDALNNNIRSLQTLSEVSSALLAAQGFDAGLETSLPNVGETLGAVELGLFVHVADSGLNHKERNPGEPPNQSEIDGDIPVDPTGFTPVLRHHWSPIPDVLSPAFEAGILRGYRYLLKAYGKQLQAGELVVFDADSTDEHWRIFSKNTGFQQAYAAPVFVGAQFWGSLLCIFESAESAPSHLESFFSALATNLGVAIARQDAQRVQLRERNLLRSLIDNAPDFVYIKDLKRRYIVANRAFVNVLGYAREDELIGLIDEQVHPPKVAAMIESMELPILRGERSIYTIPEEVILPLTKENRWMLTTKAPFFNVEGEIQGLITISRDITEMKDAENRLREAKEAAEAATRAKSEFLANMSHEIRTPMNGVIGMTSLLLSSELRPEQREFVETIRTSSDDLLMILNDLLDYSKIESGKMELEQEPFDPLGAVEDMIELYSARRNDDAVAVCIIAAADIPRLAIGDITRFRQIVGNLVANAQKFTAEGSIVVRMTIHPEAMRPEAMHQKDVADCVLAVSVRDTGIGIPASRLDRLFQSFTQVDSSTTRRYGGTGLGLAISKRLVEMMDGEIGVESVEGEGSNFYFHIRLGLPAPEPVVEGAELNGQSATERQHALSQQGGPESSAVSRKQVIAVGGVRLRPQHRSYRDMRFGVALPNAAARDAVVEQIGLWGGMAEAVGDLETARRLFESWGSKKDGVLICHRAWYAQIASDDGAPGKPAATNVTGETDGNGKLGIPVVLVETKGRGQEPPPPLSSVTMPDLSAGGYSEPESHRTKNFVQSNAELITYPVKPTALACAIERVLQRRKQSAATPLVAAPPVQESRLADELPLRILLVEDNKVNQRVALRMLDRLGYVAELAVNGRIALEMMQNTDYDVVLMDIHMPELDGHATTQAVRAEPGRTHQPYIIAMTADAMPGFREECLASGMNDYIPKPVRLEDLSSGLRRFSTRKE